MCNVTKGRQTDDIGIELENYEIEKEHSCFIRAGKGESRATVIQASYH
jgi:hypothetical protein